MTHVTSSLRVYELTQSLAVLPSLATSLDYLAFAGFPDSEDYFHLILDYSDGERAKSLCLSTSSLRGVFPNSLLADVKPRDIMTLLRITEDLFPDNRHILSDTLSSESGTADLCIDLMRYAAYWCRTVLSVEY